jgi:putative FmdB family regulatory protein
MPLRDYKCSSCEKVWEELRKDQSDPEKCKYCEAESPKRLLAKSNFALKGTGWYQTDFKNK